MLKMLMKRMMLLLQLSIYELLYRVGTWELLLEAQVDLK